MIPRQLTIEGIYSYRKRQIIDFRTLSEAGIFGVFGNVGSGKSAILEAMTYALYGQIERLNDKEQRAYNIMNLQASSLFIDFEFSQDSIEYRFVVTAKRHKKDFNKILSPERTGYRKEGEQWIPLPDEGIRGGITAENIIGLNYEHFRKTVIIPQGKFQDFIQLPPSQRTGMIETLFGLQRFNLSAQSNILLARNREECSFLEGRLDDLQELKNEDLKTLEQSSLMMKEELQKKDLQKKLLSGRLTALTEYRKGKAALEESTRSLEKIELMKDGILEQEGLLKQSQILEELFKSLLLRERELAKELNDQNQEAARINGDCKVIEVKLEEGEKYWITLKKDQENYSTLRRTLDSLNALTELKDIKKREDQDSLKTGIISKELTASRISIRELKDKRKSLDSSMEKLEKLVDQSDELSAVEDWYRQGDQLAEKNSDLKSRIDEFKEREKLGKVQISEILTVKDLKITGPASELEKTILGDIQNKLDLLQEKEDVQKQKELDSNRLHLLSRMSDELSEGKPCPLCGSDHHPHPHMKYDVAGFSKEQQALNKEMTFLLKQKEGVLGIIPQLKYLEQEKVKSENLYKKLIDDENNHLESFNWSFIKADEREQFGRLKAELNKQRFELKELRQKRSSLENEILKLDKGIREKEGEQIRLETRSEHILSQKRKLEALLIEQHKDNPQNSDEETVSLNSRLENLDRDYLRIKMSRESNEKKLQDLRNRNESNGHLIKKSENDMHHLESEIQEKMVKQSISNREELNRLLHQSEDLEAIQKRIDTFHRDRNILLEQKKNLSITVSLLEKDPVLKGVSQADPHLIQQELTNLDQELQNLLTAAGALGEKIDELKTKLKQKESLSSDLEKQNIRGENLRELSSLFKGGKFVQYIAAVYMQEMCQLANRRFSPLTGRSLELVFQDNQIMVRDFLNEGRLRHIKTLSGGQSFQAALCLALALAEQTGRGKGSFFFLDEGFGSLYKASLETVMTTLRELSREGRIIGLISHVEEMQQDLDVWIRIKRDSEEGSRVQCSWKSSSSLETKKVEDI